MGLKVEGNRRGEIHYRGIRDIIIKVYKNEGITGFYKGLSPNMLRIFPSSGLFFLVYEASILSLQKME